MLFRSWLPESMSRAMVFSHTSTPIFCSRRCVYRCSLGANEASTCGPASISRIFASVVATDLYSRGSVSWASSAIWPATSTPVGPAPITAKVTYAARSAGSVASSAISKAPRIWLRR